MVVNDVILGKSGQTILTGPLLLKDLFRRSEIEQAFGQHVVLVSSSGERVLAPVHGISVSQTMSGSWQVSLCVDYPRLQDAVALNSLVFSE